MLLLSAIALLVVWILGQTVMPAALTRLLNTGEPGWVRARVPAVMDLPLPYVLDRADSVLGIGLRLGALLWVFLAVLLTRPARPDSARAKSGQGAWAWIGLFLFVLAPWLWLKVAGVALGTWAVFKSDHPRVLHADAMRLVWYAVFLFAFVCAPYWTLPVSVWGELAAMAALLACGWWWTGWMSAVCVIPKGLAPCLLGGAGLLAAAIHWIPAGVGLPWSGDEDYHMMQVAYLCENLPPVWMATALGMLLIVRSHILGGVSRRRAAACLAAAAALAGAGYPHMEGALARYPYALRWLEAAPVQVFYAWPSIFYCEELMRASSVVSIMGLAVGIAVAMRGRPAVGLAAAVVAATVPTLLYHGSQLYLEVPMVALLVVAALRGEALMDPDPERVRQDVGWIALTLAAFTKETVLPVLAAFVVCRLARCAWSHRVAFMAWRREARLLAGLVLPIVVYLGFRATQDVFRGHPGLWNQLFRIDLWRDLIASLGAQFGLVLMLGTVGLVALLRRSPWSLLWLCVWLGGVATLILGDTDAHVGYSRYNLMLLPPLLAVSVAWLYTTRARTTWILLALWLLLNVALSPVRMDGHRLIAWSYPNPNVGERYIPARETLDWLRDTRPGARLLIAGTTYPYFWDFYFGQLGWHPKYAIAPEQANANPAAAAAAAANQNYDVIIWQPVHESMRFPARVPGFRLQRVLAGPGVALAVYGASPESR